MLINFLSNNNIEIGFLNRYQHFSRIRAFRIIDPQDSSGPEKWIYIGKISDKNFLFQNRILSLKNCSQVLMNELIF